MAAKDLSQEFRTQGSLRPRRRNPTKKKRKRKKRRKKKRKKKRKTAQKIIITRKVACFSSQWFYSMPEFSVVGNELYLYVRSGFCCKRFVSPVTLFVRVGISPTSCRIFPVVAQYDGQQHEYCAFYTNRWRFSILPKVFGDQCMYGKVSVTKITNVVTM